jgi:hypothetical protein
VRAFTRLRNVIGTSTPKGHRDIVEHPADFVLSGKRLLRFSAVGQNGDRMRSSNSCKSS